MVIKLIQPHFKHWGNSWIRTFQLHQMVFITRVFSETDLLTFEFWFEPQIYGLCLRTTMIYLLRMHLLWVSRVLWCWFVKCEYLLVFLVCIQSNWRSLIWQKNANKSIMAITVSFNLRLIHQRIFNTNMLKCLRCPCNWFLRNCPHNSQCLEFNSGRGPFLHVVPLFCPVITLLLTSL